MLFNLHTNKKTVVDDVTVNNRQTTDSFEIKASFSESEKDAMKTVAQVIERLHSMDNDRMGWIATLCDKVAGVINAATAWQKVKLEREKVALQLAQTKMRVSD